MTLSPEARAALSVLSEIRALESPATALEMRAFLDIIEPLLASALTRAESAERRVAELEAQRTDAARNDESLKLRLNGAERREAVAVDQLAASQARVAELEASLSYWAGSSGRNAGEAELHLTRIASLETELELCNASRDTMMTQIVTLEATVERVTAALHHEENDTFASVAMPSVRKVLNRFRAALRPVADLPKCRTCNGTGVFESLADGMITDRVCDCADSPKGIVRYGSGWMEGQSEDSPKGGKGYYDADEDSPDSSPKGDAT